jgi:hypothetical protein
MFHVVFQKVPLYADVFGLLADQCVAGVSYSALVVFPYCVSVDNGGVEDLPYELAKV